LPLFTTLKITVLPTGTDFLDSLNLNSVATTAMRTVAFEARAELGLEPPLAAKKPAPANATKATTTPAARLNCDPLFPKNGVLRVADDRREGRQECPPSRFDQLLVSL